MKVNNWLEISKIIFKSDIKDKPIMFDNQLYDFMIFGYPESRKGFIVIWNIISNKAILISRIKIPDNIEFKYINLMQFNYHDYVPENLIFEENFIDINSGG